MWSVGEDNYGNKMEAKAYKQPCDDSYSDSSSVYSIQAPETIRNGKVDRYPKGDEYQSHNNNSNNNNNNNNSQNSVIHHPSEDNTVTKLTNPVDEEEQFFAKAESNSIFRSKLLVLGLLLASIIGLSLEVYYFGRGAEQRLFESNFEDDATKLLDAIGSHLGMTLTTVDGFVVSIISLARSTNQTWPFVTVPDYAVQVSKIRSLSRVFTLGQYHWVTEKQRILWEEYTNKNDDWVQESVQVQKVDKNYRGRDVQDDLIVGFTSDSIGEGPFLPGWQNYPVVSEWPPYNFDGSDVPALTNAISELWKGRVVISEVSNLEQPNFSNEAYVDGASNWASYFISEEDGDPFEPFSHIFYPIIDTAAYPVKTTTSNGSSKITEIADKGGSTVGVFFLSFFWRDFFREILPTGSNGIVVVIRDGLNQAFTYQINGPQAVYLGPGDLHDATYDHMTRSAALLDSGRFSPTEGYYYTGLPIGDQISSYYINVYPSSSMELDYRTSNPIILSLVAGLILFVTFICFMFYDCLVEKRQQKVMNRAVQSNAILSSMFPKTVRDRLFQSERPEDVDISDAQNQTLGVKFITTKHLLQNFLNDRVKSSSAPPGAEQEQTPVAQEHNSHNGSPFHFPVGMNRRCSNEASTYHNPVASSSRPIADLFPEATVMFADIAGFTAWSSMREPTHVFQLLETLYGAFDVVATRRGVFKVETIGDSYVAVSGLPEPRGDHAIVMARFARDCRHQMSELTKQMETTLGPDTGDLQLRFGLHSGPVTAGVLRGRNSRFQLFGDTVNTASRMESTGVRNKIHVSQATAELLIRGGKSHWINPRQEVVQAKGKGQMQTYWVEPGRGRGSYHVSSDGWYNLPTIAASNNGVSKSSFATIGMNPDSRRYGSYSPSEPKRSSSTEKVNRLIDWNVDILSKLICQIIASRESSGRISDFSHINGFSKHDSMSSSSTSLTFECNGNKAGGGAILDEVKEIIEMPEFDPTRGSYLRKNCDPKMLPPRVFSQLRDYVEKIASLYHYTNPFHNFEHAAHVGMSVVKLLNRIVATDDKVLVLEEIRRKGKGDINNQYLESSLHEYTYGITSDPLTQFACVFAALIHDVDHPGVPNSQLIKEQTPMATAYKNKSIAEQNSVDVAWKLLFQPEFEELRLAICATPNDMIRFRELVVNSVMATDVLDKDLLKLRNARWDKAFSSSFTKIPAANKGQRKNGRKSCATKSMVKESDRDKSNRKATIVIEHLIQASDVSHTMQHWHVFRKWNERLFQEMYDAYDAGRALQDPSEFWYRGELNFFDYYVIPLAKKLSSCGVFGVSSDEYLNYAQKNREEWELRGQQVVAEMTRKRLPQKKYMNAAA